MPRNDPPPPWNRSRLTDPSGIGPRGPARHPHDAGQGEKAHDDEGRFDHSEPDEDRLDEDRPDEGPPAEGPLGDGLEAEFAAGLSPVGAADPPLSYMALSRTPLTSLVFTLPLVLAYEGGVLLLGRGSPRNGADVWLRQALDGLGFGAYFLLPVLTVLGLLAWHHVEHDRWHFSPRVLVGMAGESLLWALLLVGFAQAQHTLWPLVVVDRAWSDPVARLVAFCGAGLYEEVLFRLLMLPAVAWSLARLGASQAAAAGLAILATSGLFSIAHYVGPLGDDFEWYSFCFRLGAGIFFAIVFLGRGFGIAAGTHAIYDMLVGLA